MRVADAHADRSFPFLAGRSGSPPLRQSYSGQVDAALRQLNDQLDQASQRLLDAARVRAEPDLRAPSLLPGWSRAHVLAHVARNADAMRNLLIGARVGQRRPAYASAQAREDDIEASAAQVPRDLMNDLEIGRA